MTISTNSLTPLDKNFSVQESDCDKEFQSCPPISDNADDYAEAGQNNTFTTLFAVASAAAATLFASSAFAKSGSSSDGKRIKVLLKMASDQTQLAVKLLELGQSPDANERKQAAEHFKFAGDALLEAANIIAERPKKNSKHMLEAAETIALAARRFGQAAEATSEFSLEGAAVLFQLAANTATKAADIFKTKNTDGHFSIAALTSLSEAEVFKRRVYSLAANIIVKSSSIFGPLVAEAGEKTALDILERATFNYIDKIDWAIRETAEVHTLLEPVRESVQSLELLVTASEIFRELGMTETSETVKLLALDYFEFLKPKVEELSKRSQISTDPIFSMVESRLVTQLLETMKSIEKKIFVIHKHESERFLATRGNEPWVFRMFESISSCKAEKTAEALRLVEFAEAMPLPIDKLETQPEALTKAIDFKIKKLNDACLLLQTNYESAKAGWVYNRIAKIYIELSNATKDTNLSIQYEVHAKYYLGLAAIAFRAGDNYTMNRMMIGAANHLQTFARDGLIPTIPSIIIGPRELEALRSAGNKNPAAPASLSEEMKRAATTVERINRELKRAENALDRAKALKR